MAGFTVQTPTAFGCPPDTIFSLPTKEELVNAFNKIAQIPSKLRVYLVQHAKELAQDVIDEINAVIKTVEDFIDKVQKLLSPYWSAGKIREWQKEAADAFDEIIKEFHTYIPTKIAELIMKLVPIDLIFKFGGLAINIIRIFDPTYQSEIRAQIAERIDYFFNLVPNKIKGWNEEFGILCNEWKAKLTWSYIKTEISKYLNNTLHAVFGKLIDIFDEIWDLLGLPSLIGLLTMPDIATLINNAIQGFMKKRREILEKLKDTSLTQLAKEKLLEEYEKISKKIGEALDKISVFGFNIVAIIGGKIDTTVEMLEQKIAELKLAFEDFMQNWQKKLLFDWVKIVKKFFSAIGLGSIFKFLFFTFCDFLKLLGFPPSIPAIPTIAGVMTVESVLPNNDISKRLQEIDSATLREGGQSNYISATDEGNDDGLAVYTADGNTDRFALPEGSGDIYVFKDGKRQTFFAGFGQVYFSVDDKVVFRNTPEQGALISVIR